MTCTAVVTLPDIHPEMGFTMPTSKCVFAGAKNAQLKSTQKGLTGCSRV